MLTKLEYEKNLERIHEWIRVVDQKIGIFLALQGVVITLFFPRLLSWLSDNYNRLNFLGWLFISIGVIYIFCALIKSILALIPRLKNSDKEKSITYFGDIAEMTFEDFKRELVNLNEKDYENELIKQIYISAIIAKEKHLQFRESIIGFIIGGAILGLFFTCIVLNL